MMGGVVQMLSSSAALSVEKNSLLRSTTDSTINEQRSVSPTKEQPVASASSVRVKRIATSPQDLSESIAKKRLVKNLDADDSGKAPVFNVYFQNYAHGDSDRNTKTSPQPGNSKFGQPPVRRNFLFEASENYLERRIAMAGYDPETFIEARAYIVETIEVAGLNLEEAGVTRSLSALRVQASNNPTLNGILARHCDVETFSSARAVRIINSDFHLIHCAVHLGS
eukprot:TRINITY_DN7658_c1_g3_i5.p1 TRINITY_DN7658_c1_g3~~TRINITY_DN7658_c1_g3_i5.p1  ORF type:complete len:224 (+),score=56.89 TRINITY_DN7658_c1_g3_i5:123-794(+)